MSSVDLEESKDDNLASNQQQVSPQEIDARIIEAFLRCWLEILTQKSVEQNSLLPMEPSTFKKEYLALYADPNFGTLNLKDSSYKKVIQYQTDFNLDWTIA